MVDCWLPYGETQIYVAVDIDQLIGFAEPQKMVPERYAQQLVEEALFEPSGGRTLELFVEPGCTVSIALEGTTPPKVAATVLSAIVKQLVELVVPRERIIIVVGNGVNSSSYPSLIETLKTHNDISGVNIIEHTRDTHNLVEVGITNQGTPVKINRNYSEASLKIAIGRTQIDPYTGFSGAFSAIVPGISGMETVLENRRHIFKGQSKQGVIELNPIKEDAIEAVKMVGIDFAVNLVLNYDDDLLQVYTGGFEESWGKACTGLGDSYEIDVESGADVVLVSAGGISYDRSLYGAIWALDSASLLVKRNGAIVLLAECSDGLGAESFTSLARVEELSEFKRRFALGAETIQMLKRILKNNRVVLVSALPSFLVEPLGLEVARTANEAYENIIGSRRGRKTLVIPHGCSSLPKIP
jgi:nickel-dependent lactate racemase